MVYLCTALVFIQFWSLIIIRGNRKNNTVIMPCQTSKKSTHHHKIIVMHMYVL